MSLIQITNLNKYYGVNPAVADFSIELQPGKIVGVVGPNGCGKTTLFKCMTGLIGDYTGDIRIDGAEVGIHTKSIVSFLPERTYLSDWMKARDAIHMFMDYYADFDAVKATELMRRFGLDMNARLKSFSKGMQEKMQLILVMSRRAKLYILDEPLSGIDPAARDTIMDIIIHNFNADATVLLSTHLVYDVERIFDEVLFMSAGRLLFAENVDALRERTGKSLDGYFREVFSSVG